MARVIANTITASAAIPSASELRPTCEMLKSREARMAAFWNESNQPRKGNGSTRLSPISNDHSPKTPLEVDRPGDPEQRAQDEECHTAQSVAHRFAVPGRGHEPTSLIP